MLGVVAGCTIYTSPRNVTSDPQPQAAPTTATAPKPAPAPVVTSQQALVDAPAPQPEAPRVDPPKSTSRALVLPAGIGAGRPASFEPTAEPSYFIWQGPRGGWRIRTTTKGVKQRFRGHIQGTTGSVVDVDPSRVEFRDDVWKAENGWAFDFSTANHADGFTFHTRDNGCVRFDLILDDGGTPKRVVIGLSQHQPATGHFILCPKGATPSSARGG